MFKIIILMFLAIFLGTVIENVYAQRNELCAESSTEIAEETQPVEAAPAVNDKKFNFDTAKEIYNNTVNKATIGLADFVKEVKCENK